MSGLAIQAVITDLSQRADALGYDHRRAIERLAFGSFVSPANRYFYLETPKAACTTFKHLIAGIEGTLPDPHAAPYQRETKPDMRIHERRHLALPTLLNAPAPARHAILAGEPGWMRFAVVRNPFSRLVSFFEHKVRMGEPGYGVLEARYGATAVFGNLQACFERFAEEVVADASLRNSDSHLMPQTALLMPRLIPYSHVFRLEAVDDAITALSTHLGKAVILPRPPRATRDWRGHYNARSAEIVTKAYADDFAQYGYDPADWRLSGAPMAANNEEFWRREVVARNAMIQMLYDRLGVPPANSFVPRTKI